jgi:hypothetical protein
MGQVFISAPCLYLNILLAKGYHARGFAAMAFPLQGPAHTTQVVATGANFSQIEE